ncbi:unnamed protein product [Ilex paraguariensis]|uniref:C2H2-type domain-containing protein n=1 Tax=Ilex paraguariensis TaxID=185542 RepID=A0ABC8TV78_9AQUA
MLGNLVACAMSQDDANNDTDEPRTVFLGHVVGEKSYVPRQTFSLSTSSFQTVRKAIESLPVQAVPSSAFQQLHLQKLAESQGHQLNTSSTSGSWMWNPTQPAQEDDDSWEVRAFAEDTGNIDGTTWPPRFYNCTFCRREFKSAQALGGHMNVHRRDRARLHQTPPGLNKPTTSPSTASSSVLNPDQKIVTNGGLCVLYSLPNHNGVFIPTMMTTCMDSPSNLISLSSHSRTKLMLASSPVNLPVTPQSFSSSLCHSSNTEPSPSVTNDNQQDNNNREKDFAIEELDLELRLGLRSPVH